MRKVILAMAVAVGLVLAYASIAGMVDEEVLSVTFGTNSNLRIVDTNDNPRGFIETIDIVVPANSTANYSVVYNPVVSGLDSITLASTNNCTADTTFRPRFDGTDTSAAALDSDPPWRYAASGGAFEFAVTNVNATGETYYCRIVWEGQ
jgi:hypothetical protein